MKSSNTKRSRTGTYKDAPKSKKARTRTALPDLAMEQCLPPPSRIQPSRTAKSNHHQIPTTTPSPQQQQQETSVPLIRQKRTRTTHNSQTAIPLPASERQIQMQQDTVAKNNAQQIQEPSGADPSQVEQPIVENQSEQTGENATVNPPADINPSLQANAANPTGMEQQQVDPTRPLHLQRQDFANPPASQNRVQVQRSTSDQIPIRPQQPNNVHVLRAAAAIGNRNLPEYQNSSVVANSNQNNVAGALRHTQLQQRQHILAQNIPLHLQPQQPPFAFPYQQPKQLLTKKVRTRTALPCLGPSAITPADNVQSQRPSTSSQQKSNDTSEHQAQSGTKTATVSRQDSQSIVDSTSQSQKKPIDVDSLHRLVAVMKKFGERFQKKEITSQQFRESLKDATIEGIPKGSAYEVWSKLCEQAKESWKSGKSNNGFNDVIQIQRKFNPKFCVQLRNVATVQSNAGSQRNGTTQNVNGPAVVVAASTEASKIPTSQNDRNGQSPAAAPAPRDTSEVPPNPAKSQSFPDLPQINGQPQTHVVLQLFENQLKQYQVLFTDASTGYQNIVAKQIESLKNLSNSNNV